MELAPYLFFYGRCEEALEFYKTALGGTYDMQRIEGSPMAEHVAPDFRNKVMHATFKGAGMTFMASDGGESKAIDPDSGNIAMSLATKDKAEGERIFAALGSGGSVKTPLADAFWGGQFGVVVDRFGIEWLMSTL